MKLLSPRTQISRPITDRVKESLFSVLYKYDLIEGGAVADLFSGTGSMGLESLSRGARSATFIEQSAKVVSILKQNIEKADFSDRSTVLKTNVFKAGAPVTADVEKYDLVFVDPPYVMSHNWKEGTKVGRLLELLNEQVNTGAIVVVRTHKRAEYDRRYGNLEVVDIRKWGTMAVVLLQMQPKSQSTDVDIKGSGEDDQ